MKCKAARHAFSLMEVVIVIVLVGVIAGVSGFSLVPLYRSYQFRLEAEALYGLFQELQLEAMTLQSDMEVRFKKENNKWVARSYTDEKVLKPQTIDLSHVEQLSSENPITFYSNGLIDSKGTLKLSNKGDHRWIDLSRGHLIKLSEKEPQPIVYEKLIDLEEVKKILAKKNKK